MSSTLMTEMQRKPLPPSRRRGRWLWLVASAAACVPLALVFLQSAMSDLGDSFLSEADRQRLAQGLEIEDLTIYGRSSAGEPFSVNTEVAVPDGASPERIRMQVVNGETLLEDGRVAKLTSGGGMFFVKKQQIRLIGGVRVETNDGYWLVTDTAQLDTNLGRISTEGEVLAGGRVGRIRADRLERVETTKGQGQRIVFEGNVRVTVQPED